MDSQDHKDVTQKQPPPPHWNRCPISDTNNSMERVLVTVNNIQLRVKSDQKVSKLGLFGCQPTLCHSSFKMSNYFNHDSVFCHYHTCWFKWFKAYSFLSNSCILYGHYHNVNECFLWEFMKPLKTCNLR